MASVDQLGGHPYEWGEPGYFWPSEDALELAAEYEADWRHERNQADAEGAGE